MDALRWWVIDMHVDGFRFDLASILGRDQQGKVLSNPPVVEMIAEDPVLADTKIIAEAWDAAGLYQVGNFSTDHRWAEWNGRFRDDVRGFMTGTPARWRTWPPASPAAPISTSTMAVGPATRSTSSPATTALLWPTWSATRKTQSEQWRGQPRRRQAQSELELWL